MSFLDRFRGRRPAPAPSTAVTIPEDVALRLNAGGVPLSESVVAALREHLDAADAAAARAAEPAPEAVETERVPFWLGREKAEKTGIEEALRDRLERRRATEAEDAPPPAPRRGRKKTAGPPPQA